MGQKSNPILLRLNKTNQHWNSCWYSHDNYATSFLEDCKINAYIKSSQQQLERFPPLSFVKRQRGDLKILLLSAKPARQFSNFKGGNANFSKSRNYTGHLTTHHIFNGNPFYEDRPGDVSPFSSTRSLGLMDLLMKRGKERGDSLRLQLLLATTSYLGIKDIFNANTNFSQGAPRGIQLGFPLPGNPGERGRGASSERVRNHLQHSIYKYYQKEEGSLSPLRSKLYLVKSPSIYQNPFFLLGQLVSLLEERRPFRQIKHRVVREIRRNPVIKGVRIICSGRVASRSKKAQKARRESIQWGATSLNVFSEHVYFASSFAQTTFGKIGVKVWISYRFPQKSG